MTARLLPAALIVIATGLGACSPKPGGAPAGDTAAVGGAKDACGAGGFQQYVGRSIGALNEVDLPEGRGCCSRPRRPRWTCARIA